MILSCWNLHWVRNVSDKSCSENQNKHFMFINSFPKIVPFVRQFGNMWYSRTGHRWRYNSVHVLCVPEWQRLQTHSIYRVSHELRSLLREGVPYVKLYRYNRKHLYQKLNGYGDNNHRKVWASVGSKYCTPSVTPYSSTAHARQRDHYALQSVQGSSDVTGYQLRPA
jgi:hypothetical protein